MSIIREGIQMLKKTRALKKNAGLWGRRFKRVSAVRLRWLRFHAAGAFVAEARAAGGGNG
jgi:hypothetical protein